MLKIANIDSVNIGMKSFHYDYKKCFQFTTIPFFGE